MSIYKNKQARRKSPWNNVYEITKLFKWLQLSLKMNEEPQDSFFISIGIMAESWQYVRTFFEYAVKIQPNKNL